MAAVTWSRLLPAAAAPVFRVNVVGAHPWVYAATQPNYDLTPVLPQVFADFHYAGIAAIELMHTCLLPDDAQPRIAALAKEHQLPVLGASFGGNMWDRNQHDAIWAMAEKIVPRLSALGGRTFGTSVGELRRVGGAMPLKTTEQLDAQAEFLLKLRRLCADHGIVVNLHNHTYEVENGLHDLHGTLARIPDIKLGPDLNWLIRGGVDPVAFIRQYRGQIVFMHLRDQRKDGRWVEAIGEGDTDFAAIAAALREVGFQGDAVVELAHEKDFKPTRPLRESVKLSRDYVRRTMGF